MLKSLGPCVCLGPVFGIVGKFFVKRVLWALFHDVETCGAKAIEF